MFEVKLNEFNTIEGWFCLDKYIKIEIETIDKIDDFFDLKQLDDKKIYSILKFNHFYIAKTNFSGLSCYGLFNKTKIFPQYNSAVSVVCKLDLNDFIKECKKILS